MTRAELLKVALLAAGYNPDASESTTAFSDVSEDDWFMPYVAYAYKNGFIEGYTDGSFGPANQVTRAKFVTMAGREFL